MDKEIKTPAFLILAHTDPEQLYRLIQALDGDSSIFVHLDGKSDLRQFDRFPYPDHVQFIEDRLNVSWAGFNMVLATLHLIRAALKSGGDYSHLVLLSGLDYPIKPVVTLKNLLNDHPGKEFIRFINVNDSPEHYLKIYRRLSFKNPFLSPVSIPVLGKAIVLLDKVTRKALTLLFKFYRKKPLKNIIPCFGSQWWAITPQCARYIVDYADKHPAFLKYFRTSFGPDEYFFHTIVGNSPFLNQAGGFQQYESRGTSKMANLHVIHPSLSKVYTISDFDGLRDSDKYFVRKITTASSKELVEKINHELLQTPGA